MCKIIITMICADSEQYSLVFSDLACKCYHLCGVTLSLSVRRLPWLFSSSPSSPSASKEISSSYYGSYYYSESYNKSSSECFSASSKKFHVRPWFHVGPENRLVLVEYWLTHFHPFCHIFNCRRHYFCCSWYLLLIITIHNCHCQTLPHHNTILKSRQNWILRCLLNFWYLIPAACCPGLQVRALCLITLGVMITLVKLCCFTTLLICICNNL